MKFTSTEHGDVMEYFAHATARQQRDQYLHALDQLLASLGDEEPASLEEIRQLFTTYEPSEMRSLSSDIEAMREER